MERKLWRVHTGGLSPCFSANGFGAFVSRACPGEAGLFLTAVAPSVVVLFFTPVGFFAVAIFCTSLLFVTPALVVFLRGILIDQAFKGN
jgi:hypothetical protein